MTKIDEIMALVTEYSLAMAIAGATHIHREKLRAALESALKTEGNPFAWALCLPNHSPYFSTDKNEFVSYHVGSTIPHFPNELIELYTHPPRQEPEQTEPVVELGDGFMWCETCGSVQESVHHADPQDHDIWCKGEARWIQGPFYTAPPARDLEIALRLTETDDTCTEIYKAANQETVKSQPLTTKRIFAAMRYVENLVRKQIGVK